MCESKDVGFGELETASLAHNRPEEVASFVDEGASDCRKRHQASQMSNEGYQQVHPDFDDQSKDEVGMCTQLEDMRSTDS